MSVNNDEFLIEQADIDNAQYICNGIQNTVIRNRAMSNVVAVQLAKKYFNDIDVDAETGLYSISKVLEDIDVSDIYIKGNYIDVRIYSDENEMFVPKSHFDMNILPVAYMFIKVDEELSSAVVSGFIFPEDVETNLSQNGCYMVKEDALVSYYDVEPRLALVEDEGCENDFKKIVYDFTDGRPVHKEVFYSTLLQSAISREFLKNAVLSNAVFTEAKFDKLSDVASNLSENDFDVSADTTEDDLIADDDVADLESSDNQDLLEETAFDDEMVIDLSDEEPLQEISDEDVLNGGLDETESLETDGVLFTDEESVAVDLSETPNENMSDFAGNEALEADIQEEVSAQDSDVADAADMVSGSDLHDDTTDNSAGGEILSAKGQVQDDIEELSKFDYSTEIAPSMSTIENAVPEQEITEEMLESSKSVLDSPDNNATQIPNHNNQIDNLFENNKPHSVNISKKKKGSPLTMFGLLFLLCALGYYGYTKYFVEMPDIGSQQEANTQMSENTLPVKTEKPKEEAMPIETVENTDLAKHQNEAAAVSIPAIEQNLSASIDVSNLTVTWEVPVGYANNATAKRYFVKLGKVLQLNIKTELLMLSSPPITNKIRVELEFDKNNNKFSVVKVLDSSGVLNVDNVIKETIGKTLDMNMNMNMNVFGNLQGNPVLIIKL